MDNAIDIIYTVVHTIIFASAIGMLFAFLLTHDDYNRNLMLDMKTKSSVEMNDVSGYSEQFIYVSGNEVFTDIINQNTKLPIYLDGTLLTEDYLKFVRENNLTYTDDLRSMIDLNGEYMVRHRYYSNNEIKAIYYEHR